MTKINFGSLPDPLGSQGTWGGPQGTEAGRGSLFIFDFGVFLALIETFRYM